jgi:hypothetical protein
MLELLFRRLPATNCAAELNAPFPLLDSNIAFPGPAIIT